MEVIETKDNSWVALTLLAVYFVVTFVFILEPYLELISPLLGFLAQLSISTSSDLISIFLGLICPMILAFAFLAIPFVLTNLTIDRYEKF